MAQPARIQAALLWYGPQVFERSRDFAVISSGDAPPRDLADRLVAAAQAARDWRARQAEPTEVWQFLMSQGHGLLMRTADERRGNATAETTRALWLPPVGAAMWPLAAAVSRLDAAADQGMEAGVVELLGSIRHVSQSQKSKQLWKAWISGVRPIVLQQSIHDALALLQQVLIRLPLRDRNQVTFSSVPLRVSRDFVLGSDEPASQLAATLEVPLSAALWLEIQELFPDAAWLRDASLSESPSAWLRRGIDQIRDYADLAGGISKVRDAELRNHLFLALRDALEESLSGYFAKSRGEAAAAMLELEQSGWLTVEFGIPDLWFPRIASEYGFMRLLPDNLLCRCARLKAHQGWLPELEEFTQDQAQLLLRGLLGLHSGNVVLPALQRCKTALREGAEGAFEVEVLMRLVWQASDVDELLLHLERNMKTDTSKRREYPRVLQSWLRRLLARQPVEIAGPLQWLEAMKICAAEQVVVWLGSEGITGGV